MLFSTEPRHISNHDADIAREIGAQLAIALENAHLYQKIRHHAAELEHRVQERTAALQVSETKYRALVEFAPNPIVIVNEAGMMTMLNQQAITTFGYDSEECIGRSIDLLVPNLRESVLPAYLPATAASQDALYTGTALEWTARRKNGVEIPVKIGLSPMQIGSELLTMLYIIDCTTDKQLEASLRAALAQEQDLSALKTSFTSMVSHEFRTPLSVIQSSVDLLATYAEHMPPDRRQEKLHRITLQVERLVQLLDDVLLMTRTESAGFAYKPARLDVVALCEEICAEVQASSRKDITVTCINQGCRHPMWGDEFLFRHILQNLVANAVKYSFNGGIVRVLVTCTASDVRLCIEDQGIGIPLSDQSGLFEAFRRASNVGQIPGTGIGLAIVKRAVDTYGGTIAYESREGHGTTFTVTLPATERNEENGHGEHDHSRDRG